MLPFSSEPVFIGLHLAGAAPMWLLVAVASVGNTLGAFVNYWLGWRLESAGAHRWLKVPDEGFDRARRFWDRWGVWTLLLSWLPVGEVTTLLAGALRTPLWLFAVLVGLAKTLRYVGLALVTTAVTG